MISSEILYFNSILDILQDCKTIYRKIHFLQIWIFERMNPLFFTKSKRKKFSFSIMIRKILKIEFLDHFKRAQT